MKHTFDIQKSIRNHIYGNPISDEEPVATVSDRKNSLQININWLDDMDQLLLSLQDLQNTLYNLIKNKLKCSENNKIPRILRLAQKLEFSEKETKAFEYVVLCNIASMKIIYYIYYIFIF